MPRKLAKYKKIFDNYSPFFLISLGITLMLTAAGWRFYQERVLSFEATPVSAKEVENKNVPQRITIPKVNMALDIHTSSINNGVWEISNKGGSYLNVSAGLGQGGNTVIYGHNKASLFGPIRWLKKGDKIILQDMNWNSYEYIVEEVVVTTPDDVQYVEPKDKEMITIYTCTGLFDSKRHIIVAYPLAKM